jgi:hypothetical protein
MNQTATSEILTLEEAANYLKLPLETFDAFLARVCGRQHKAWGGALQRGTPGGRSGNSFSLRSRRQPTRKSAPSSSTAARIRGLDVLCFAPFLGFRAERNVSIALRHLGEKFRLQEKARLPLPAVAAGG